MPIVTVRGLSRTYTRGEHKVHALREVDLDIEAGEFTALMGPSGSGKTTLLNLIGGLDAPTAGSVVVEGTDLAQLSAGARSDLRRERLGFVFQAYNLIPVLSAAENAEFVLALRGVPAAERRERAHAVLAQVGLKGLEDRRPGQLSGGQQQRVAVARALAGNPAVILADEPTANLDSTTGHDLIELMRELNTRDGATFIFATHDPKVLDAARRVIRLVDGEIDEDNRK
ncbi:MAG: ABC transporter ATP-binding protein [Deltaproteobacteria bacterium]|nr:MAG: ABC transporter ATP-binding protein [Deltaproteobacteria bacterium]